MEQRTTTSERIMWNKDKNRFMVRRITRIWNFDEIRQERLGKNAVSKTVTWHELDVLPEGRKPEKKIILPIVLKRTALDPETLNTISAYFSQDLQLQVLSDSIYIYQYLIKSDGKAYINNLNSGQCVPIALTGNQVGIEKKFLGKERRITDSEALKLIELGCPVYEKFGSEYRILC